MKTELSLFFVGIAIVCLTVSVAAVGFEFPRGEIPLVEPDYEADNQDAPQVAFDLFGNAHAVWEDDRLTGNFHMYGCSVLADGTISASYPGYTGLGVNSYLYPYIFKADSSTYMYGFTIDTTGTSFSLENVRIDPATLPGAPITTDLSNNPYFGPTSIEYFDMVQGQDYVFYVYKTLTSDSLFLGGYQESGEEWVTLNQELTAPANYRYIHPRLAMDDAGYIYIAYDREFYDPTPSGWSLMARRSVNPLDIASFYNERYIMGSFASGYRPVLAVTGAAPSNLKVAVAYFHDDIDAEVFCTMEENGDWVGGGTWAGPDPGVVLNSYTNPGLNVAGPEAAYDSDKNLYVVWTDDRMGYTEFYGNYSLDGGVTFESSDFRFAPGLQDITGEFSLDTGPNPGDIALAYIRDLGSVSIPCMLYSGAALYDSCDQDPGSSGQWSSWGGIFVDNSNYVSPPASYQFVPSKGMLMRDFGATEYLGRLTLQLYDSNSSAEDFWIGVSNNNEKGVIRMLGVKNNVSSYCYSLDGGVTWQPFGGVRSAGWHEIVIEVMDTGTLLSIETSPGSVVSVGDGTLTSFTTIETQGGGTAGSFNIDNVRLETILPEGSAPLETPSMSLFGLLATLMVIGGYLILRR